MTRAAGRKLRTARERRPGAARARCSADSAWSRRNSPRHVAACSDDTTSIHSNGGATSSKPRKRAKPTGVAAAATATLASTTSFTDRCARARRSQPSWVRACRPQAAATRVAGEASDRARRGSRPSQPGRSLGDGPRSRPRVGRSESSASPCRASTHAARGFLDGQHIRIVRRSTRFSIRPSLGSGRRPSLRFGLSRVKRDPGGSGQPPEQGRLF